MQTEPFNDLQPQARLALSKLDCAGRLSPWSLGFWIGLMAMAAVLGALRYLPFQDVPNHTQLLLVDRALTEAALRPYYQRPDHWVCCYGLCTAISRWTAPWLTVDAVVRWLFVASAVGLPLAVARLAAALEIPAGTAGLLSLPLGLSFPLAMGFLPYVVGLPLALLAATAALEASRDRQPLRWAELTVWLVLSYWAHALTFLCAGVLCAMAWFTLGEQRLRLTFRFAFALVPTAGCIGWDWWHQAFGAIEGVEGTFPPRPLFFRPLGEALANLVTHSYCISGPRLLACYLPLLILIIGGAGLALWEIGVSPRRPADRFLVGAALLCTALALGLPQKHGLLAFLASRLAPVAAALWSILAAAAWSKRPGLWKVAFATVGLAVGASLGQFSARALQVEAIVGARVPRSLAGSFLVVRLNDGLALPGGAFGDYDPLCHVWAYLMSPEGVTPYLFAYNRFHPVWYDGAVYRQQLIGPTEKEAIASLHRSRRAEYPQENGARLQDTLARAGFAGVVVFGRPDVLQAALATVAGFTVRPLAPGAVVLTASAPAMIGQASALERR